MPAVDEEVSTATMISRQILARLLCRLIEASA